MNVAAERVPPRLIHEYIGLNLTHMPGITRVSSGQNALLMAQELGRFDKALACYEEVMELPDDPRAFRVLKKRSA